MHLITLYNLYARRTIAALAALATLSVFLYGALMLSAVAHAAGRTAAERELATLESSVSRLENTFLQETKSLSPERARALGFVPVAPALVSTIVVGADGLTMR